MTRCDLHLKKKKSSGCLGRIVGAKWKQGDQQKAAEFQVRKRMVWSGMMGDLGYIRSWSHRTHCRMDGGGGGRRGVTRMIASVARSCWGDGGAVS